jgi:hypothetical protein
MAQTFIEQSIEARWNAAQQIKEWLRPQVEELRVKLEKAEEGPPGLPEEVWRHRHFGAGNAR